MTARPKAVVLRAPGTNCDRETVHALELAGAEACRMPIWEAAADGARLDPYPILVLPGGFTYGDDLGAGRVFGLDVRLRLRDALVRLHERGGLILGICNGFQVLVQSGLLPHGPSGFRGEATLAVNDSRRFEARWVGLDALDGICPFTRGLGRFELPIANGEGKFILADPGGWNRLESRVVLRYVSRDDGPADRGGSERETAGLCDPTGRILGMMPHPERFVRASQHPAWTRRDGEGPGKGLQLFLNAVDTFG